MTLIEARGLRRDFAITSKAGWLRRRTRVVTAVDAIDLTIERGEMVGYIGPNGAGKSTTLKMLTGVLSPSGGSVRVCGFEPVPQRTQLARQIGVLFGHRSQLWWDLPLAESFALLRHVYGVRESDHAARLARARRLLELDAFLDVPVRQLSLGQRMRCDLAAALLHAPDILFLDEPTIGLDAVSKLAVRAFIQRLNRDDGVTVILTTHDMDDIEALCTRVMVIAGGQILSDGTLGELRRRVSRERWLTIDLAEAGAVVEDPDAAVIRRDGARVWQAFDPEVVAPAELIRRVTSRCAIRDLFVENPPIETVVARLYAAHRLDERARGGDAA